MDQKILEKLVSINSVSQNSNLSFVNFCALEFKKCGFKIKLFKSGNKANLFSYRESKKPKIILSAHSDTVPPSGNWKSNPFELKKIDNTLSGLGVCDMKSFIAVMLSFAKKRMDNLAFLLTFNEEVDFEGAKLVTNEVIGKNDFIIIGEPTKNKVISGTKGFVVYQTEILGKAGHSSNPKNGISAIEKAAVFINELSNAAKKIKPTLNFGKISGGTAINIIAEKAVIDFEFRIISKNEIKKIDKLIFEILRKNMIKAKVTKVRQTLPYKLKEKLYEVIKKSKIEIAPGVSYCTEAAIFNKFTDNIIVFGPGDAAKAHKENESIKISEIVEYEKLLEILISKLSG